MPASKISPDRVDNGIYRCTKCSFATVYTGDMARHERINVGHNIEFIERKPDPEVKPVNTWDVNAFLSRPCTTTDEALETIRLMRAVLCDWSGGMCCGYINITVLADKFEVMFVANGGKASGCFSAFGATVAEALTVMLTQMAKATR